MEQGNGLGVGPWASAAEIAAAVVIARGTGKQLAMVPHGAPAATTGRSGYSGSKMRSAARSSVERSSSARNWS